MKEYQQIVILIIAIVNSLFAKTVLGSLGIGILLITILLIEIYKEVKENNKGE